MQKPAGQRSRKKPRTRFTQSFSRELMPLDMEPLLEAERLRCEKIAEDLERARASLERHRTEGEPAFSLWLNGNFGEDLSEARELEAKAAHLANLVTCVEAEADRAGCSEREAFARLEAIRLGSQKVAELRAGDPAELNGELPEEVEEFLRISFEHSFGHVRFTRKEREEAFESFKKTFREDVLGPKPQFKQRGEREAPPPRREMRGRPKPSEADSRLKQIYRELARRLHPDLNPAVSPKELELWHEVREAYEGRNLEALETLAVLVENGGGGALSKIKSVSRLRVVSSGILRNLKVAQKAVKSAKLHPSWGFERATEKYKQSLADRIQEELDDDILAFEVEIEEFEARIARWKKRR